MRHFTRTIIVLVVFSLATASFAFAQGAAGEKVPTFTISGSVGLGGVQMRGLPGKPVTGSDGTYSVRINSDWLGTVTPTKEGYKFTPDERMYMTPIKDLTNQDYAPAVIAYRISGQVGIPGVEMAGLPYDPITDNEGIYAVSVPYGWAGVVAPMKEGYTFMPPARNYAKVTADLTNHNYAPIAAAQGADARFGGMYGASGSSRRPRQTSAGYRPAIAPTADRKVLVVPAAEVKAEDLAEIMEDMQVMSHILDERFKETRRVQGAFTDFGDFFGRDNRTTEAIYLQGYGVLFSMEVNFAFSPPPKPQGQGAEQTAENVDSTWQRARQQVFSSGDPRSSRGSNSAEEYDSRMVEELKRDLITTLKHAANIRGVQIDEWIILTVIGGGRQAGGVFGGGSFMMGGGMGGGMMGGGYGVSGVSGSGGMMGGMSGGGMGSGMMGGMGGGMMGGGMGDFDEMGVSPATVLTIRAAKCDVDAFAKGEQDFEQFRQKVQIYTY